MYWCERFSPIVGFKQDQPDSLLMEVTGVAGLHGGEAALLCNVVEAFYQRGLIACAAGCPLGCTHFSNSLISSTA